MLFTETEAGELVRRAAELQEQGSEKGYIPGISLDELKQMAVEVGVDPEFLLKAISEQRQVAVKPKKGTRIEEVERVLPVEVHPNDFDKITENIKLLSSTYAGIAGAVRQVGRSIEGQIAGGIESPKFKVISRDGRTKLRVWRGSNSAAVLPFIFIVPLFISLVVGLVLHPIAGAVLATLSLLLAFITFHQAAKATQKAIHDAADTLEAAILEHGKTADEEVKTLEEGKPKGPTPAD